jgi:hypothetical protein
MSQPFDQSIPVLTEVFTDTVPIAPAPPKAVEPQPAPPAAVRPPAPPVIVINEHAIQDEPAPDADAIGAELQALATETWTEPEWKLLEQRVTGRILQQLDARIDATLDNQLRDSLADVLQFAMASLSIELRAGLQQAIEQTVTRAVAHELAQLKTPHRK